MPSSLEPLGILDALWRHGEELYPGERGRIQTEPVRELAHGLVRITLEVPSRRPMYELCLDALTAIDVWCRQQWSFPSIYDWPIRYEAEPPGLELWASTAALFARGFGDCEDLSCDVTSLWILNGVPARSVLRLQETNATSEFFHVVTELPDGSIEDPSLLLGM